MFLSICFIKKGGIIHLDPLEKRFQNIEINRNRLVPPKEETEKQKSKSKFKNFAMTNKNYEEDFINIIKIYPNALNVFVYLIFQRNKYNNECNITINQIIKRISIFKENVRSRNRQHMHRTHNQMKPFYPSYTFQGNLESDR